MAKEAALEAPAEAAVAMAVEAVAAEVVVVLEAEIAEAAGEKEAVVEAGSEGGTDMARVLRFDCRGLNRP